MSKTTTENATIVAIATAVGPGGIGIVRVSGSKALNVAQTFAPSLPTPLVPRLAHFSTLVDAQGSLLDEGVVLFFAGPRSFTGEDVVEFQVHGSPAVLTALQRDVATLPGVRLAKPGEFTERAFLNGRIDLVRAEAIADLISAQGTAGARDAALRLSGVLSQQLRGLKTSLIELLADIEANLEFLENEENESVGYLARIEAQKPRAEQLLGGMATSAHRRRSHTVVLVGPPNAGKSTLFNALAGADRALVDSEPGTTRDLLEARDEVAGLSVTWVDTAGLREGAGRLEALGIARAKAALKQAALAVLLVPPGATASDVEAWSREVESTALLVVRSKADVDENASSGAHEGSVRISGVTGEGVSALREAVASRLSVVDSSPALLFADRHAEALGRVVSHLDAAAKACRLGTLEMVAGELVLAAAALGTLTGEDARQETIETIFRRFCIGK